MPGIIVIDPDPGDLLPICTDQDVKDYLKIDQPLNEMEATFLSDMIDAATNWIETILNRKLKTRSYSGSMDGNGDVILYPEDDAGRPLCPITVLTSLVIDGTTIDVINANEVLLYGSAGYIRLVGGSVFSLGFQNINLKLTAGFTTIPPILIQACCELVAQKWYNRDKQKQDIVSLSMAGQTVSFRKDAMLKETYEAMMLYRKVIFA